MEGYIEEGYRFFALRKKQEEAILELKQTLEELDETFKRKKKDKE